MYIHVCVNCTFINVTGIFDMSSLASAKPQAVVPYGPLGGPHMVPWVLNGDPPDMGWFNTLW